MAEFGGKGNVASITDALQEAMYEIAGVEVESGWYFPSIGAYTALLEKHGLAVQSAVLFDRPTKLEESNHGLRNWLSMFCAGMLVDLPAGMKQKVIEHVEASLRPRLFREGTWFADYRRLRVVAMKT